MAKIIWALELNRKWSAIEKRAESLIRTLSKGQTEVQVQPVHLLMPERVGLAEDLAPPSQGMLFADAQEVLGQKFKGKRMSGLLEPEILSVQAYSRSKAAKTLNDYAKKRGADMIVVGTHSRAGLPRLVLGSFTEALIMHSEVPVLTVDVRTKPVTRFRRILVPLDFESGTELVFRRIVAFAKEWGSELVLFHSTAEIEIGGESEDAEVSAAKYIKQAKLQGVKANFKLAKAKSDIAKAILESARSSDVQLIAMAEHAGPIAATMLGSVTRELVRKSSIPVWVMHTRKARRRSLLRAA